MCLTIFLLADRQLPVPPDATAYPGLMLYPVEAENQSETLAGIERIAPAPFVYNVSPSGYCGCYFGYETLEEFQAGMAERAASPDEQYANSPEQAERMWRSRMDAVKSFERYLAEHLDSRLAVYAVWEHCAGENAPVCAEVTPKYFGGPAFARLPEDVLLNIVPESAVEGDLPWDPAEVRSHEWLDCLRWCELNDGEDPMEES